MTRPASGRSEGGGVARGGVGRIAAIPTTYARVRFRSRLEARWAAMFDQLGLHWSYEPTDHPGWIPDFLLMGETDVLAEVKPFRSILDEHGQEGVMDIWRSAPSTAHVLLLGTECAAYLREPGHPVPDVGPGAIDPWRVGWGVARFGRTPDGKFDIWHMWGSPVTLLHRGEYGTLINPNELLAMWREAGNRTQWKAPR